MERWCPLTVKQSREWVLQPDYFPTWVGRWPLGKVGQEMGYKLLRLRIDSRKVDIWFLELDLQWRLLRRAAECCAGRQRDRQRAAPGGIEMRRAVPKRAAGLVAGGIILVDLSFKALVRVVLGRGSSYFTISSLQLDLRSWKLE
ncbi:hypothetical protein Tco_0348854 [Tanacetum coccineum]